MLVVIASFAREAMVPDASRNSGRDGSPDIAKSA
jgi:hypothetical protein